MITTDKLNWYAAYTRVNQELVIKKKLDRIRSRKLPAAGRAGTRSSTWSKKDPGYPDSRDDIYPDR